MDYNYLNRHSQKMSEIISKVPPWLVRWGTTAFFLSMLIILFVASNVSLTSKFTTKITINCYGNKAAIKSPIDGIFTDIKVIDNSLIKKDDVIAVIQYLEAPVKADSVISPVEGKIHFVAPVSKNLSVKKNDLLFYILPPLPRYYATGSVPFKIVKNVKIGEKVGVTVNSTDSQEIKLNGYITFISEYSDKNGNFSIKIDLDNQYLLRSKRIGMAVAGDLIINVPKTTIFDRVFKSISSKQIQFSSNRL